MKSTKQEVGPVSVTTGVGTVKPGWRIGRRSLPKHDILIGLGAGLLVIGVTAISSFIPDLSQTSLFDGITTNTFLPEWWTLLGVTLAVLGVLFAGVMLPVLLLRGARVRHYVAVFVTEIIVIIIALALVTHFANSQSTGDGGNDCSSFSGNCIEPGINPGADLQTN